MSRPGMYFESHINVQHPPKPGSVLACRELASLERMKVTMMDGHDHLPDPTVAELVVTGHGRSVDDLERRVRLMIHHLKSNGFRVTRYKIEEAVVDSRVVDEWGLLDA